MLAHLQVQDLDGPRRLLPINIVHGVEIGHENCYISFRGTIF